MPVVRACVKSVTHAPICPLSCTEPVTDSHEASIATIPFTACPRYLHTVCGVFKLDPKEYAGNHENTANRCSRCYRSPVLISFQATKAAEAKMIPEQFRASGMAVHAYLHRKEGSASNADYWYQRAGRAYHRPTLDAEREALVEGLLTSAGKT